MPIYGYRCAACGHQKDVLQKMSDAPLTECPACGEAAFTKEVSAPAFQLKGTGWYVTDFRDGNSGGKKPDATKEGGEAKAGEGGDTASADAGKGAAASTDSKTADNKSTDTKSSDSAAGNKSGAADKKASPAPAPAPAAKS